MLIVLRVVAGRAWGFGPSHLVSAAGEYAELQARADVLARGLPSRIPR